jgi:hypothetical protein
MQPGLADFTETSPGVLAGGGTAVVRLFVFNRPAPQEPPIQWSGVLEPEKRADGTIVDWRLVGPLPPEEWERLRNWRSGYVTERMIGDVATVRAFIDWADRHCDVSALHGLRLLEAHFSTKSVMRVARQTTEAGNVCRSRGDMGVGLFGGERGGLIRGFDTSEGPVTVLADRYASVTANSDRLTVLDSQAGRLHVTEWQTADNEVMVQTPNGDVSLGNGHAAALLRKTAPGFETVSVRSVPLTRIFAELLGYLPEMAREAANSHAELVAHASFTPWR